MKSLRVLLSGVVAVAMAFGFSPSTAQGQGSCAGDVNDDGVVSADDLAIVLSSWGSCPGKGSCAGDVNSDGMVSADDLAIVLSSWGSCPPIVPTWATLIEALPDPAVVTDATLRNAIIASGFAWRIRDNSSNIEMLLVPPGTFQMGCIMGSDLYICTLEERPVHTVTLTNAYYLGRYEVTQAEWQAKMGSNPSYFTGQADSPSRPVEQVSWNTIQNFNSATGLRLPTEAEWEFACRAGTTTPFHSGPGFPNGTTNDGLVGTFAWYESNSGGVTHAVGGKAANALGMHDMLGNAFEWCSDWIGAYSSGAQTNPTGPGSGSARVLRGGMWGDNTGFVRSSDRYFSTPGGGSASTGFRVARTPS